MLLAVPFITLIYVLINVSYLTVLSVPEMINAPAVAVVSRQTRFNRRVFLYIDPQTSKTNGFFFFLQEFGARALGNFTFIIPLGVVVATFGCALSVQFETTRQAFRRELATSQSTRSSYVYLRSCFRWFSYRICFAASRGGQMLKVFSYVSVKKLTPAPAVVLQVRKFSEIKLSSYTFHLQIVTFEKNCLDFIDM